MSFVNEKETHRNKSSLSYVECVMILMNEDIMFESMSHDDLDSIYRVATGHWSHHLTRQGHIERLYIERSKRITKDI